MEFISIEAKVFEDMVRSLELLKKKVERLSVRYSLKRMGDWIDNQEACNLLRISPRTLQTLRGNGTLSYTQIDRRTYYRREDVIRLLELGNNRHKPRKGARL